MLLRQVVWAAVSLAGSTFLIRALGPEDWASYGIAFFLVVVVDQAFGTSLLGHLVRKEEDPDSRDRETAAAVALIAGFALASVLLGFRHGFADWYGRAELADCLLGVAGCVLVYAWRAPSLALLERDLRYGTVAAAELLDQLTFYVVALTLIAFGAGLEAAIVGLAVRGIPSALLLRTRQRMPHLGRLHAGPARAIVSFGAPAAASSILILLNGLIPVFALGGDEATQVAFFLTAATIVGYAASAQIIAQRVAFPSLALLSGDTSSFDAAFKSAIRLTNTILVAVILPLGALSPLWLPALLGEEWSGASWVAVALCAGYLVNGVLTLGTAAQQSLGRPRAALVVNLIVLAAYTAVVVGAAGPLEAVGVAIAFAVSRAVGVIALMVQSSPARISALVSELALLLASFAVVMLGAALIDENHEAAGIAVVVAGLLAWVGYRRSDGALIRRALVGQRAAAPG